VIAFTTTTKLPYHHYGSNARLLVCWNYADSTYAAVQSNINLKGLTARGSDERRDCDCYFHTVLSLGHKVTTTKHVFAGYNNIIGGYDTREGK